jgi:hypothetical protein
MRSPPRQSTTINERSRQPWRLSLAWAHHGDDLLDGRLVPPGSTSPYCEADGRRGSRAESPVSDAVQRNREQLKQSSDSPRSRTAGSSRSTSSLGNYGMPRRSDSCRAQALPWGHEAFGHHHHSDGRDPCAERRGTPRTAQAIYRASIQSGWTGSGHARAHRAANRRRTLATARWTLPSCCVATRRSSSTRRRGGGFRRSPTNSSTRRSSTIVCGSPRSTNGDPLLRAKHHRVDLN